MRMKRPRLEYRTLRIISYAMLNSFKNHVKNLYVYLYISNNTKNVLKWKRDGQNISLKIKKIYGAKKILI